MSRFLSTYSSDFIAPGCSEDDAPSVSYPENHCKKCARPCQCMRIVAAVPSPAASRRSSCTSTTSCVRSIQQIDFTAVPPVKGCRCNCQCCVSAKPERQPKCKPDPPPCPPQPILRPVICVEKCCVKKPKGDPCCALHRVRTAQAIAQNPDCYLPVCHCKPRLCPPPPKECNSCLVRNDDPDLRHIKSQREPTAIAVGGCDDEGGGCSRNSSRLRFDMHVSSNRN